MSPQSAEPSPRQSRDEFHFLAGTLLPQPGSWERLRSVMEGMGGAPFPGPVYGRMEPAGRSTTSTLSLIGCVDSQPLASITFCLSPQSAVGQMLVARGIQTGGRAYATVAVEKGMTPAANRPRSNVVPLLVAALVCDAAVEDPSTGKKSLIGIFDLVHVEEFPTRRPISLYFKVADAEGFYEFEVRYVHADTGNVLFQLNGELTAGDRLEASELHVAFPPLPMPAAGRYEFQVWANSMFLGSVSIRAVQQGV